MAFESQQIVFAQAWCCNSISLLEEEQVVNCHFGRHSEVSLPLS